MEVAYAQALWKMAEQGMAPKGAVDTLYENLRAHGREALMPRIGRAFARIAQREAEKQTVTLSIAREKDLRLAKSAAKDVLAMLGTPAKDVAVQVDESLIGGWRLEGRETLVDSSFKRYLLDMYNRATTN